jgi:translation initiation factor 2 subunit 3
MATNGDFSDEGSQPGSPSLDAHNPHGEVEDHEPLEEKPIKSAMKKAAPPVSQPQRPVLPEQPDPETLDLSKLTPLTPEIIARQATQNIGM